jgi:hypothetical protein
MLFRPHPRIPLTLALLFIDLSDTVHQLWEDEAGKKLLNERDILSVEGRKNCW